MVVTGDGAGFSGLIEEGEFGVDFEPEFLLGGDEEFGGVEGGRGYLCRLAGDLRLRLRGG